MKKMIKLIMIVCLFSSNAFALEILPDSIEFSKVTNEQVLNVYNNNDYAVKVSLKIENFIMNKEAHVQRVDNFEYSLKPFLQLESEKFNLEAGEHKNIKLKLSNTDNFDGGDYHSHLTYSERFLSKRRSISVDVSLPVLYKEEKGKSGVLIKGAKFEDSKFKVSFTKKNNKKHASTWVEVTLRQPDGSEYLLVTPFYNMVYRESNEIERTMPYNGKPKAGGKVTVKLWQGPKKKNMLDELSFIIN